MNDKVLTVDDTIFNEHIVHVVMCLLYPGTSIHVRSGHIPAMLHVSHSFGFQRLTQVLIQEFSNHFNDGNVLSCWSILKSNTGGGGGSSTSTNKEVDADSGGNKDSDESSGSGSIDQVTRSLFQVALRYLQQQNYRLIFKDQRHVVLSFDGWYRLLSSIPVNSDNAIDLVDSISAWVKHDRVNRAQYLTRLMSLIQRQ